jgi:toxin YoeB
MKVTFSEKALEEYWECAKENNKKWDKINNLIKDIQRNGFMNGTGKPEFLKHMKVYSREIDDKNRLTYIAAGEKNKDVEIVSCKGHYGDK